MKLNLIMNRHFFPVLVLLLAMGFPMIAYSYEFQDGLAAAQKGDFSTAQKIWMPLAKNGDPRSQYFLGVMYDAGNGVDQDPKEAIRWYTLSANQSYPPAQYNLGEMYRLGIGTKKNLEQSFSWLLLAATNGHLKAQSNVGLMYKQGLGVEQNYLKASNWYHIAASRGDYGAMNNLGVLYSDGLGVPRDHVKAYMWFTASLLSGNSEAKENLDVIGLKLTSEQIEVASQRAKECLVKKFDGCLPKIKM